VQCNEYLVFFPHMAPQPVVCLGLSVVEASRSHSDTPHSLGLLWTSDQPDAETFTWQHNTHKRHIYASYRIRTRNPSQRAAADPRLRPRRHRYRPDTVLMFDQTRCFELQPVSNVEYWTFVYEGNENRLGLIRDVCRNFKLVNIEL
jgi:hypothetical protein